MNGCLRMTNSTLQRTNSTYSISQVLLRLQKVTSTDSFCCRELPDFFVYPLLLLVKRKSVLVEF